MPEKNASDELITLQRQVTIVTLVLISGIILFQIFAYFADILRILGISILFSYLFIAVVDWLQRYLKLRILAVLVVYLVVIVGTVFSAIMLIPTVVSQISQFLNSVYQQLPELIRHLTQLMLPFEKQLHAAQIEIRTTDLVDNILSAFSKIEAGQVFDRVSNVAFSTVTWTAYGLCVLLLSFYFLLDGYKMRESIIKLFPLKYREQMQSISFEIDKGLQAFFKGQVIMAFSFGLFMTVVYYALGVHYALLLGILLALWEVIPVVGPPIGFLPAVLSVAFDGMDNIPVNRMTQVILIFICFNALQWLKDNIAAPKYMGNVMGLHPVIIFLAIIIGAKIDGLLGVIFALPVACALNVLVSHCHVNHGSAHNSAKQKHHPE